MFTICRTAFRVGTKSYSSKYGPLSDIWFSTEEMGAAQIHTVTEIAPKSPLLSVNRSPVRYGSCARKRVSGIAWTPIWYEVLYSPRNDPDPEMIPNPEMIPKSTPKWSPFLFTSTPKWSPINSWNGMVFRHGIITSLLQRLRSWIAFNISLQFMWFFSAFAI